MGGYGSGRQSSRPTVEEGLTLDLGLLVRRGWIRDGAAAEGGTLCWSSNGEIAATIGHSYDLTGPNRAHLTLTYALSGRHTSPENVKQRITLVYTRPTYGGRRWWMICPTSGRRVAKLHLPPGGDRFASRLTWGLTYRSQRSARRDRPFDRLFRLQGKLRCETGWGQAIYRPKGMWRRTFERHQARHWKLSVLCDNQAGFFLEDNRRRSR